MFWAEDAIIYHVVNVVVATANVAVGSNPNLDEWGSKAHRETCELFLFRSILVEVTYSENKMLSYSMPKYGMGTCAIGNDANLKTLAYGISQLICWGHGCGAHRLKFTIYKNRVGVSVFMDPDVEPQVISAAACCTQEGLHEMGLLPKDIPPFERMNMDGCTKTVNDGQSRFSFKKGDGSLIQNYDVRPDISMATWSFAYADQITGFVWRGAREIRLFHSLKLTQIYLAPALPDDVIKSILSYENYPQDKLISDLS